MRKQEKKRSSDRDIIIHPPAFSPTLIEKISDVFTSIDIQIKEGKDPEDIVYPYISTFTFPWDIPKTKAEATS